MTTDIFVILIFFLFYIKSNILVVLDKQSVWSSEFYVQTDFQGQGYPNSQI